MACSHTHTHTGTGDATRGVLILPGLGNNAADYEGLSQQLSKRGMDVEVAPITRLDWSKNAAGLADGVCFCLCHHSPVYVDRVLFCLHHLPPQQDNGQSSTTLLIFTHSKLVERLPHATPHSGLVHQQDGCLHAGEGHRSCLIRQYVS